MENDPLYHQLRETGWRRKLTAPEEKRLRAWLSAHPEAEEDWGAELKLNEALCQLKDTPVSSNFTARVLQAAQRDTPETAPTGWLRWPVSILRFRWFPRVAVAAVVLCAGLLTAHRVQDLQRQGEARKLIAVSDAASLLEPDALENFKYIQVMDSTPGPDDELLKLLQ